MRGNTPGETGLNNWILGQKNIVFVGKNPAFSEFLEGKKLFKKL
tara:strand:- start:623 stop:754 length:132 start_codon:yes stop_codon:yes gene_type:complete